MAVFLAYQHPHGISLNGREYLLEEPDGEVIQFRSIASLVDFINRETGEKFETISDLEEHGIYIERVDFKERLHEALDAGTVDKDYLISAFIKWLSDDDVEDVLLVNEINIGVTDAWN